MNDALRKLCEDIIPAGREAMEQARERQEKLAKPPGSLGKLEEISIRLAGITGKVISVPKKPAVLIMAADNGVAAQGVSSAPQSVTMSQTINFTRRLTGAGALSKSFGTDLLVVDAGINGNVPEELLTCDPFEMAEGKILNRKTAYGTKDLSREDAMTREQAIEALMAGAEAAGAAVNMGYDILGIGEMGIGNTTTGTAVLSALTGADPEVLTGRGGGITDPAFRKKKDIISRAAESCAIFRRGGTTDVIGILSRCGGFDICAMTGAYLQAARQRIPVVIDGFISSAAALCAAYLAPNCCEYMFASHVSEEPGYLAAARELQKIDPGISPMLDISMRLGEGSGCILAFQIIKGACAVMKDMATFEEAGINDDYLSEIRKGGCF